MDLRVSWRRRYSSYVALYLARSVPILVYQMGKGGSSTLRNTLLLRELHPVLHLHTFSPLREKRAEDVDVPEELEESGQDFLRVDYEDLWTPEQRTRLLDFLDVPAGAMALTPRSVKQNPRDLRCVLANFEELAEALRGDDLRDELLDLES
jgi:hypothetical protein